MPLFTPKELHQRFPVSKKGLSTVLNARKTINAIFERQDPRLLIVVGPCSIHNVDEGLEFARCLKALSDEVKDFAFLVMRAYIEKPRTQLGWKGLVHDPHLNGSEDIERGLELSRKLLIDLAEMGMPAATEFLTPNLAPYFEDLISWGCIGARTSSSQIHRLLASYLPMPIGFKNTLDGSIDCAANGVLFAKRPHSFLHVNENGRLTKVKSSGNSHCHIVLRGGKTGTNFSKEDIEKTLEQMRALELAPRVLIDCSHGNCQKKYFLQKEAFHSVLDQFRNGNQQILGMMLEGNLEAGAQSLPRTLEDLQAGVSITDPCLDYSETKGLIASVSQSASMSLTKS